MWQPKTSKKTQSLLDNLTKSWYTEGSDVGCQCHGCREVRRTIKPRNPYAPAGKLRGGAGPMKDKRQLEESDEDLKEGLEAWEEERGEKDEERR